MNDCQRLKKAVQNAVPRELRKGRIKNTRAKNAVKSSTLLLQSVVLKLKPAGTSCNFFPLLNIVRARSIARGELFLFFVWLAISISISFNAL